MKKTAFLILMIVSVCVFGRQTIFAQTGVSLEAEIQNMEKTVNKQGVTPAQRHETLARLARLKQLSGDIEGAAKNWFEAAAAIPGNIDDDALLACAGCLAAMGEWDRAGAALEPLVSKIQRARFLDTVIKAIQSGDVSALAALTANPQFSQMKSEIYFMLWKISKGQTAESWRGKLLAEYPQSPEGRLAAGESSPAIVIRPSPFWFFANGLDSLESAPVQKNAQVVSQTTATSAQPQNKLQKADTPVQTVIPAAGTKLQTGIYGQQANADIQMEKLRKAGFTPFLEKRDDKWAVMVPAGTDQGRMIRELREAGFESFPVK